ncbi:cytochrome P450 2J2-like isoform X3 [Chanodichthys erythropterus]|uniref:cytochrome P450 2J2-like isoform X3 n=1 Tax=Chanodichthys erythropterus TaxID=933992 RepID=UPI00351E49E0
MLSCSLIFINLGKASSSLSSHRPWPLPFLGTVFTKMDFRTMHKLAEVYGKVFSLRVGSEKLVIVSGYKTVKEALITQNDSFIDRPNVPLFHKIYKGNGLTMSNGYVWRMHRRFAAFHLRTFGEGKKVLEHSIQQECVYLCEAFKEEKGPFNPMAILHGAVSNTVACLTFGQRFDYHDECYQRILRLDNECVQIAGSPRAQLYNVCPWLLEYLPGPHQTMFSNYIKIKDFLKGEITKHREDWDPSNPRDFIDSYLTEMEKKKSDPEAGFNIEGLVISCLDVIEAGTETGATTLRWSLLFMIKFPEIQEKVQAEIDKVIGQSRQPCLADRVNMPYTDAVIHEIQRFGDVVPLGFPKHAVKDTTLAGVPLLQQTCLQSCMIQMNGKPQKPLTQHTSWMKMASFGKEMPSCHFQPARERVWESRWLVMCSSCSSPPCCSNSPSLNVQERNPVWRARYGSHMLLLPSTFVCPYVRTKQCH